MKEKDEKGWGNGRGIMCTTDVFSHNTEPFFYSLSLASTATANLDLHTCTSTYIYFLCVLKNLLMLLIISCMTGAEMIHIEVTSRSISDVIPLYDLWSCPFKISISPITPRLGFKSLWNTALLWNNCNQCIAPVSASTEGHVEFNQVRLFRKNNYPTPSSLSEN